MERKENWKKYVCGLLAALVASVFLLTGASRQSAGQQTARIVVFGDSVYGNVRDESAIPAQLEALTGMKVYNVALGGSSMARRAWKYRLDYSEDSLSVVALAKAVYAGEFGVQRTIRSRSSITEYFPEAIRGLEQIDFSTVEVVVIGSGTNDYYSGVPLDNARDPKDEDTFAGALRQTITYLRSTNPKLRIILVTPTYSWLLRTGQTCEEFNEGGILEDYISKEIEVAEELGVELLDLYHDFLPHEQWEDWELYTTDGVHPNGEGRSMIAEKIAECLKNN